jgi:hypothetical protein
MVTHTLADVDMARVQEVALEGILELALVKPDTARRIRTVLELQGGVALQVARWEDGMVGISVAHVQVAMVPLERLLPRYDA